MPFVDEQFDVIIMCEVLEHLNFNPLPLLKEINRIGAPGSMFYVSMPNAASIFHRWAVAQGYAGESRSAGIFRAARPQELARRQRSLARIYRSGDAPAARAAGLSYRRQYYFSFGETQPLKGLRSRLFRRFLKRWPVFKENQTTIAIRDRRTELAFDIPQTVHPTLRPSERLAVWLPERQYRSPSCLSCRSSSPATTRRAASARSTIA